MMRDKHCVKSARIRSYSGPHFPAFGQNTKRYSVSLRIQPKCGKMRTGITPNADTFHAVLEEEFIKYVLTIKKELNIKITLEKYIY